ncbi:restriction endonuclease subunit S [Saccharicrinis sp. FJH62]|uniref:restriction endonuclease subunit S n=1 Tax=Saccharicrinis sp. FJH62 TaxID=3344657 RepID=UPI0035D4F4FE
MIETLVDSFNIWGTAQTQKSKGKKAGIDNLSLHGINRLRELILELAVRGKLVEQDAEDEPAIKLLQRIEKHKEKFIVERRIKKQKKIAEITSAEKPHNVPKNWTWSRLQNICTKLTDGSHNPPKNSGKGFPMLSSQNVTNGYIDFYNPTRFVTSKDFEIENQRTLIEPNDILLTIVASLGRSAVVPENAPKFVLQRSVAVISSPLNSRFLSMQLIAPNCTRYYDFHGKGTAQKGIYLGKLGLMPIAIPPLAEQHRIVAKVDELMALCDKLEQQQMNHIETHLLLVKALLKTLTDAKDAEALNAAWQHLEPHFDILFTTEESIDLLKQTILQLAVMGKLVPQDKNDEPASKLLKKIEAEKLKLIKEGKLKKQKPLPEITEDEKPFELPEGWEWIKFGLFSEFINGDRGKNYPNKSEYVSEGVAWINTGHIEPTGKLTTRDMNFITREKYDSLRSGKIERDDLVYCLRGATFGKTAFVEPYEEGAIASSLMIIRPVFKEMKHFIFLYLTSPFAKQQLFRFDNGSAQPNLSANSVLNYYFPLPPLSEQHRIVTKVDELMALCDQLKERIVASQEIKVKLADAVVERAVR